MSIELWLAFAAASAVLLLIIPGPTILTIIAHAIAHGRRATGLSRRGSAKVGVPLSSLRSPELTTRLGAGTLTTIRTQ